MLPYVPQHSAHRRLTAPRLRPRRHDGGTKPATAAPKPGPSGAAARCRAPRGAGNLEAAQRRASGGGRSFTAASWCCGSAVIRRSSSRRSVKAARTVLFFRLLPSCLSDCLSVGPRSRWRMKKLLLMMMMRKRMDVAGADRTDPGPRRSTKATPPPPSSQAENTGAVCCGQEMGPQTSCVQ